MKHSTPNSSSQTFLNQMSPGPDVCFIPLGAGNPYGYPHAATISRLQSVGCTIYRADLDGDVKIESDGDTYTVYP